MTKMTKTHSSTAGKNSLNFTVNYSSTLTSTASEVNLGLESEEREGEGDGRRGPHRHQHRVRGVEGGDRAQHEALTH